MAKVLRFYGKSTLQASLCSQKELMFNMKRQRVSPAHEMFKGSYMVSCSVRQVGVKFGSLT
jgi:hypothetical protein